VVGVLVGVDPKIIDATIPTAAKILVVVLRAGQFTPTISRFTEMDAAKAVIIVGRKAAN
jgi:hypothetical protein